MKNRCKRVIVNILLAGSVNLNSTFAFAESDKSLNSEFQRVIHSLMGGEMIFSCGYSDTTFKITSGVFSKPTLYWKSGIEWKELEDTDFKDTGVIFRGLGREGGVPIQDINIDLDLPIFNEGWPFAQKTAGSYFVKSRKSDFVPYEYTIDMIESSITSKNILPIVDHIKLDREKYEREQSKIEQSNVDVMIPLQYYSDEEKIKEKKKCRIVQRQLLPQSKNLVRR
jgi:hypothetical protein